MKILVIDTFGESVLDWILRCMADGHKVVWHMNDDKKTARIGRGFGIEITHDWQKHWKWADLVFMTDNIKHLVALDQMREGDPGKLVVAPSKAAAEWETERMLGQKILQHHGIDVPPCKEFTDYDQAIAYVKKHDKPFVSKPCGNETDKSLSYVSKSPADLVFMLERWKKAGKLKGSFILQEKIAGVEMGVGAWFGPAGWLPGWEENFEFKKLLNDDLGVSTGEQGTVMRFVRSSKLANEMLKPLASALEELRYVGCIDVNCIIDDKGKPWPLEFTTRPGWPSVNIQQVLHQRDHAQWLADLAAGHASRPPWRFNEIAVGVVMTIPDYPYSHATQKEVVGVPVYGVTSKNEDNIHPCMMMWGAAPQMLSGRIVQAPCLLTAGDYVLVATGTGSSVRPALRSAYRVLKTLEVPCNPGWRTDIGKRLTQQLPEWQKHGDETEMLYSPIPPS